MEQEASSFSPIALVSLLVLGYLIWSLPRRLAACPLLVMVGLMPMGQELDLFGLHFYLFRILLLLGMVRVVAKGEFARLKWTPLDKYFAWWVVVSITFGSLSPPSPSMSLMVNRLGDGFNAVCCYYFVRCVIRDVDDIVACIRTLALVSVPLAVLMLVERSTLHNPFSVLGGVPEYSPLRDGHVRAQGSFRHAILAGTFGATQFPLFLALWFYERRYRWLAITGAIAALVIVYTASSSGALIAAAGAIAGLGMWKFRSKMRLLRRGTVGLLVLLTLVMNAPVWYILAKVSDKAGGGGWHRAYVIDQAVAHLNEWWLFGTTYTAHWGPSGEVIATDPNMMDITNHYIMEGVKGGILKLGLFIAIVVGCFKIVGRRIRAEPAGSPAAFLFWAMGVSLFAHCLSFISVTYFDQLILVWFWLQAIICGIQSIPVTDPAGAAAPEEERGPREEQPHLEFQY
jgi:hypothetical protein